jgi:hypothetical protein
MFEHIHIILVHTHYIDDDEDITTSDTPTSSIELLSFSRWLRAQSLALYFLSFK